MPLRFLDLFKPKRTGKQLSGESVELLARAGSLHESGQLREAAAAYRSILERCPGHSEPLHALAAIALQAGNFETAISLYDEIIDGDRNDAAAYYKRGNAFNALGRWDNALKDYDRAIKFAPRHPHALCNRGSVLERLGRWDDALSSYDRALALDPDDALTHFNRASVLKEQGKLDAALASYDRAISCKPNYADAHVNRGNLLRETRRFDAAVKSYDAALEIRTSGPACRLAHHGRGLALAEMGNHEDALASYDAAIRQDSGEHRVHTSRGLALKKLKRLPEALAAFERSLALNDRQVDNYFYRGQVLHEMGRFEEALASFDQTIALTPGEFSPYLAHASRGFALAALRRFDEALVSLEKSAELKSDHVDVYCAAGYVLQQLHRYEEAVASYDRAIVLNPQGSLAFAAHRDKAFLLKDLKRLEEALASYDCAIALKADDPEVYLNRGCVLQELGCHEEAIASFGEAISLRPALVEAHQGRAFSLLNKGRHEMALASFDQAIVLKPDQKYLLGFRRYVQMQVCDWTGIAAYLAQLETDLRAGLPVSAPFQVLALVDSPLLHRLAAEVWVNEECPPDDSMGAIPNRQPSGKIKVGYFSADFRNHPVSLLTAELFETHDRSQFEIIAFAFGPRVQDAVRARLERSFDRFVDVSEKSDWDVVEAAREMALDIAVDLGGFTEFARPKVFAMRAAPIQMSYIGYLGTMGAPYVDYVLADPVIIPPEARQHYSEKIVYLPSYQVNDSRRPAVEHALPRAELGLPATGFVFSCFNSNYKIGPATFDTWMRILARVDGSHLFLYTGNEMTRQNLRAEASRRFVDPDRIVFGEYLQHGDYLARFRAMDLFLDTLPYNAGTTASDALWAGLPVLTQAGRGFAGRVAASLLTAIGLPELIAATAAEYENTAVRLATDPREMLAVKQKLARNRSNATLFDTRAFTRHLESAYHQMHERRLAGLPPEMIVVSAGYRDKSCQ